LFLSIFAKMKSNKIKTLIFDWGDTLMADNPKLQTPMYLWDKVYVIPNADIVIDELSKIYNLVVASNAGVSDAAKMKMALERVGIDRYFNYFFTSKELGYEKPHFLFFKNILKTIDCKPNECVMIGNSYEKDIVGAKYAGLFTVFFNSDFNNSILFNSENKYPFKFESADIVINDLKHLSKAIKWIEKL